MNDLESLLKALLAARDRLPEVLGDEWPAFSDEVENLIARYERRELAPRTCRAMILTILAKYQHAWELVQQAAGRAEEHGDVRETGGRGLWEHIDSLIHPQVCRNLLVDCPDQVGIVAERFAVTVRLKLPDIQQRKGDIFVRAAMDVVIRITAPAFELVSPAVQTILVKRSADSVPVVFDLVPKEEGIHHIHLDVIQSGNVLASHVATVEVSVTERIGRSGSTPPRPIPLDEDTPSPARTLFVEEHAGRLYFAIYKPDGTYRSFQPITPGDGLQVESQRMFARLSSYSRGIDPTAAKTIGMEVRLNAETREDRIRAEGRKLWNDFLPQGLRDLYASEREQWHGSTLYILTDEPYIPWELIWPYDEQNRWRDDLPWCGTMDIARWLRSDAQRATGHDGPPGRIAVQKASVVCPTDSGLADAIREKDQVNRLFATAGIHGVGPASASFRDLVRCLRGGGYDWLHVASHGSFDQESPSGDSALWLEGREALTPDVFLDPDIQGHIHRQRPGFFFNACHTARQEWSVQGLGGWANRLIHSGAGLFIAPLWAVSDGSALDFAASFYSLLLDGHATGQAMREARIAARRRGDSTWLAYALFGHPNARIDTPANQAPINPNPAQ